MVSDVTVKILEDKGITAAFGIPGAGINPAYKYLGKSSKIKHYLVRYEEAAVHAADGYFRANGKMAMVICKPITKAIYCVKDPHSIAKIMREAFKTARFGRPGPVLIDLLLDVQVADIEYDIKR